jgi:hypothetical protein
MSLAQRVGSEACLSQFTFADSSEIEKRVIFRL